MIGERQNDAQRRRARIVRLGRHFGNSARFWLDLQTRHDIAVVERERGKEIARRVRPADAA